MAWDAVDGFPALARESHRLDAGSVRGSLGALLEKYLKAAISHRGIQRIESLPVPKPALRKAILNAISAAVGRGGRRRPTARKRFGENFGENAGRNFGQNPGQNPRLVARDRSAPS